jgi:pimeloyl-ACP methyl ester carboxylesterase
MRQPRFAATPLLTASLIAALSGTASSAFGQAGAPDGAEYAHAHELVDIDHGRKLNLYCRGTGSATVIFEAGLGEEAWDWMAVHPAVATVAKACVYDRAGYGFSDPPTKPGTSANAVEDIHLLLAKAQLKPPFILAGHSAGGRIAQLYAYTYPKEVSGLVIIDTDHEDEPERANRVTGGKFALMQAQERAAVEACHEAARNGLQEGTEAFAQCVGDQADAYGPKLWPVVKAARQNMKRLDAMFVEYNSYYSESAAQLRNARKPFGDLPLVYLTRGVSPYAVPGQPQSALNKAYEDEVLNTHEEIVRLSSRGVNYVVPGAGHSIHVDRPQAVIDAVLALVAMTKPPAH